MSEATSIETIAYQFGPRCERERQAVQPTHASQATRPSPARYATPAPTRPLHVILSAPVLPAADAQTTPLTQSLRQTLLTDDDEADRHRGSLLQAVQAGDRFDVASGEPESWQPVLRDVGVYEWGSL